ncbi:MAG: DUF2333 family protein [Thiohalomonadales bacterium]
MPESEKENKLFSFFARVQQLGRQLANLYSPQTIKQKGLWWGLGLLSATLVVFLFVLGIFWSQEPEQFNVNTYAQEKARLNNISVVPGYTTTVTTLHIAETLLDKPGGYLSNDKMPPVSLFGILPLLDNIPNWEFGALTMLRDTTRVLRNDFSRSQSQSRENEDLSKSEPQFNFNNESWLFPATESEYRRGIKYLESYSIELANRSDPTTQFFTRADNLNELLAVVEKRLGSYTQRLNASVEMSEVNTDLAGDTAAQGATEAPQTYIAKTPWMEIDDVFFEARGYVWGLLHVLYAIETDFAAVLTKKNATSSMQQVVLLLAQSLVSPTSPMVLNGAPMGLVANYSKSMVSFISPANSAIIDLRNLLKDG